MKRHAFVVNVSPTLRRMLVECQSRCTADCCHALAFDLRRIGPWLERERVDRTVELRAELDAISERAETLDASLRLSVRDLESTWTAPDWRRFLSVLRDAFGLASASIDGQ
jgi:hypothetical protein